MDDIPLYIRPAIGFVMWHSERGMTFDEIREKMQQDSVYGRLSITDIDWAIEIARQNLIVGMRYDPANPNQTIVDISTPPASQPAIYGLRIIAEVLFPDGVREIVSVIVNAGIDSLISEILQIVKDKINSGILNRPGSRDYDVEVVTIEIAQFVQGGFESPLICHRC